MTDEASWKKMIEQGSTDRYAVNDLLRASDTTDRPIAFLEWSPRYEKGLGTPIADKVHGWTHDRLFAPNKDRIVVELVHSSRTLQKDAYENGSQGAAAWTRGVEVYKRRWSGTKG